MTIHTSSPGAADTSAREHIRAKAISLGFDACRFTSSTLPDEVGVHLQDAIADGHHGTMEWMERRVAERSSPKSLWPDAQSVIMLGMNYGPDEDPLASLGQPSNATLSVYAKNNDYHDLVKKRLKALGRWLAETYGCELKVFVDTAPVMEKPLAAQAGLGWQGKHTNLVSKEFGSWLFLGAIYTTLDLPIDPPETDHCGSCRACLDICPTEAFASPYRLDARRCISYLTIEHKGAIPVEFRAKMGNRIYGCDDCLAICPWNKFAQDAQESTLIARDELRSPSLADLVILDDAGFRALFRKSPIKRIGRDRFIRNVMISIGNSKNHDFRELVATRLSDESPQVRAMAVWAWQQLKGDPATLIDHQQTETDPDVLHELTRVLSAV